MKGSTMINVVSLALVAVLIAVAHFGGAQKYDDNVILICSFDLPNGAPNAFVLLDPDRSRCQGGTITSWKKVITFTVREVPQ